MVDKDKNKNSIAIEIIIIEMQTQGKRRIWLFIVVLKGKLCVLIIFGQSMSHTNIWYTRV